jgi:hypothetical protein
MCAHAEAARVASEDITCKRSVVNLSGRASLRRAVEETGVVAQEAAHGEFVEAWPEISTKSRFV